LKRVINKGGLQRAAVRVTVLALTLILASCEDLGTRNESNESSVLNAESNTNSVVNEKSGEIIGDYQYPENPAEQLRSALENDVNTRELPMEIGDVEKVEFDGKECSQIKISFTDSNENMCVISFTNKYLDYDYDESLDGRDNPSFTMVFKDPDNSHDMVTVLTSVIKYLSPGLSLEEAERLATRQDDTISTDGYSMPQDIGGYQVQAQYTNPHVFVSTPEFDAKLGVKVRALKQIWRGTIDTQYCQEMLSPEDYKHLTARYNSRDEGKHPDIVYADFIVKNTWRDQSYLHGETWVVVDIESMNGQQYSITLDTWAFPDAYEFGVGQQYTLYIGLNYTSGVSRGIMYAVQQSESAQLNSRGEVYPIDHPNDDWRNPLRRVEPEGEGTVYNVCFVLQSQTYGEQFAALEGHGIGEKQWPHDPEWEGYAFVGWYDNLERDGNPYSKDTPIYQDTYLYAKWKYSGSGGIWPRAHRGDIQGIDEGSNLSAGQKLTITASGYNMNLESPREQRFRWYPVAWRLSDGTIGSFSDEVPYEAILTCSNKGEQRLYITYLEEVFDGVDWQETGQSHEVEEVTFQTE